MKTSHYRFSITVLNPRDVDQPLPSGYWDDSNPALDEFIHGEAVRAVVVAQSHQKRLRTASWIIPVDLDASRCVFTDDVLTLRGATAATDALAAWSVVMEVSAWTLQMIYGRPSPRGEPGAPARDLLAGASVSLSPVRRRTTKPITNPEGSP